MANTYDINSNKKVAITSQMTKILKGMVKFFKTDHSYNKQQLIVLKYMINIQHHLNIILRLEQNGGQGGILSS